MNVQKSRAKNVSEFLKILFHKPSPFHPTSFCWSLWFQVWTGGPRQAHEPEQGASRIDPQKRRTVFKRLNPLFFSLKDSVVKGNIYMIYVIQPIVSDLGWSFIIPTLTRDINSLRLMHILGRYTTLVVSLCTTSEKFFFVHTERSKRFSHRETIISTPPKVAIPLVLHSLGPLNLDPNVTKSLFFTSTTVRKHQKFCWSCFLISWSPFHTRLPHGPPTLFPNFSARTSGGRKSSYRSPNPEIHHFFVDGRPGAGDTLRELPFTLPASRQKQNTRHPKCRNKII